MLAPLNRITGGYCTEQLSHYIEIDAPEGIYFVYFDYYQTRYEVNRYDNDTPPEEIFQFRVTITKVELNGELLENYDQSDLTKKVRDYVSENRMDFIED